MYAGYPGSGQGRVAGSGEYGKILWVPQNEDTLKSLHTARFSTINAPRSWLLGQLGGTAV
jgi:hypothetical protein